MTFDNTLIYATGGVAFVDAEFSGEVGPIGNSFLDKNSEWITGWTIGGGIEHAFADSLHGRLEYLYADLPSEEFRLEDPNVPIKPEHKMSKDQINKELTANGFKLVKEFAKLPWQHMMWFGKKTEGGAAETK